MTLSLFISCLVQLPQIESQMRRYVMTELGTIRSMLKASNS